MRKVKKITIILEDEENIRTYETITEPHNLQVDWKNEFRPGADSNFLMTKNSIGSWFDFKFYMPNTPDGRPGYTHTVINKEQESVSEIYVDLVPAYPVKRLTQENVEEIARFVGSNSWTVCQGSYDAPYGVAFHEPSNGQDDIVVLEGQFVLMKGGYSDKYKIKVYDPIKFREKFERKVLR